MKNNKGFSLVELIIVIAIMAILVGVMAPQLIKYIEKTNESSDAQLCDSVRTALTTASMDPDIVRNGGGLSGNGTFTTITAACADSATKTAAFEILGISSDISNSSFKSKVGKNLGLHIEVTGSNNITVYVNSSIKSGQ